MTTGDLPNQHSDAWSRFSNLQPPRVDKTESKSDLEPPNEFSGDAGLSDSMRISPKKSDTQVVDARLFPVLKKDLDWLNNLMIARVFPETLNPLRNITIKDLLQENPNMSFAEATALAEVALTVAIDGEGRMDIIHLFSKMGEAEDKDEGSKLK